MENNTKLDPGGAKNNDNNNNAEQEENPTLTNEQQQQSEGGEEANQQPPQRPASRRTPFTNLSQEDADLALARTLQEQERAYMMLRMNNDGSDYGSWEAGSYFHDDDEDDDDFGDPDEHEFDDSDADDDAVDAFDVHAHADAGVDDEDDEDEDDDEAEDEDEDDDDDDDPEVEFDPSMFSSDEAYARALQEAEEREMAARLLALAGINERAAVNIEDHGANSQDTWEEVDPDELSYEELLALGDIVGTESRGLSADTIASLTSVNYKTGSNQNGSNDSCVICRLDYEDGETLTVLSCKHSYHSECINNWLKINKVCPVCSAEVSTAGHS